MWSMKNPPLPSLTTNLDIGLNLFEELSIALLRCFGGPPLCLRCPLLGIHGAFLSGR